MSTTVTLELDDEAAALLQHLAGGDDLGEYVSGLIRMAAARRTAGDSELEALRLLVQGLASEIHRINARLVTLETANE
jgi:hypothetical protein